MIRERKRPAGTEVNTVMPNGFGAIEDGELGAVWALLKTLPPVATRVR